MPRQRTALLSLTGGAVAALGLAIGVVAVTMVANHWLSESEATGSAVNTAPSAQAEEAPSSVLIPWAWLDDPAEPAAESIPSSEVQRVAGTQEQAEPAPVSPGESCGFITCAQGYGCNPSCATGADPSPACSQNPCQ